MTRNYTITEEPNKPNRHDSQKQLFEIMNILHGAGTDEEKIERIRIVVNWMPAICDHCDQEECAGDYLSCIQRAFDTDDERRYQEEKEMNL